MIYLCLTVGVMEGTFGFCLCREDTVRDMVTLVQHEVNKGRSYSNWNTYLTHQDGKVGKTETSCHRWEEAEKS